MSTVSKAKRKPRGKAFVAPPGCPPRLENETLHSYQWFAQFWVYWEMGADIDCSEDPKARLQAAYDALVRDYQAVNPTIKNTKAFHNLFCRNQFHARAKGTCDLTALDKPRRSRTSKTPESPALSPAELQAKLKAISSGKLDPAPSPTPPHSQAELQARLDQLAGRSPEPDLNKIAKAVVEEDIAQLRNKITPDMVVILEILDRALELEVLQITRLRQQITAALAAESLLPIALEPIGIATADKFLNLLRSKK